MSSPSPPTPSPEPEANAPPRPRALATWGFGILCAGGFLASYAFGRGELDLLTLVVCGAKDRELIVGQREWWRLLTAGFLHANAIHLLVNLYALRALGPLVERLWGTRRLILIYVVALISGSLASTIATVGVSVGASGAVFGLFGAIAVFSTVHRRFIEPGARGGLWLNLLGIAAINIILGIGIPFIDNAAHAGGFAGGALAALVLSPIPARGSRSPIRELATSVASALAVAAVAGSLAAAVRYASSADWILLARTKLERRTIGDGHSLLVPRDWSYELPKERGGFHRFIRPGSAAVFLRVVEPGRWSNLAAIARDLVQARAKEGVQLVSQREIEVGDGVATDLAFRIWQGRVAERDREVLFSTPSDQLVQVAFLCPERRYRLLEMLFDEILQSITALPIRPKTEADHTIWDRIVQNPKDPEAYCQLAMQYRREGRADAAEQALRVALGLQPGYADAHDQLAHLYATATGRQHHPDLAIYHAQRALEERPDKPMYLATLALAYEAAGRRREAIETARRAAAMAPDDAHFADLVKRLEGR